MNLLLFKVLLNYQAANYLPSQSEPDWLSAFYKLIAGCSASSTKECTAPRHDTFERFIGKLECIRKALKKLKEYFQKTG